jgi:hypothetical protein
MTMFYDGHVIEEHAIEPIRQTSKEIVFVASHLRRARHESLARWPLARTRCLSSDAERALTERARLAESQEDHTKPRNPRTRGTGLRGSEVISSVRQLQAC